MCVSLIISLFATRFVYHSAYHYHIISLNISSLKHLNISQSKLSILPHNYVNHWLFNSVGQTYLSHEGQLFCLENSAVAAAFTVHNQPRISYLLSTVQTGNFQSKSS